MSKTEKFILYHQLQYDRIDKLETKRENFCNFVLTISSGFYLIIFSYSEKINVFNSIFLLGFICLINLASIKFISKTRPIIKMHQHRAEEARIRYAKKLNEINEEIEKPDSENDPYRRDKLYEFIHKLVIIFFAIFILVIVINNLWQPLTHAKCNCCTIV